MKTTDPPYLLVDHMVAKLLPLALSGGGGFDPVARLAALKRSRVAHKAFLARCDALSLLEGPELEFYNFCVCNLASGGDGGDGRDGDEDEDVDGSSGGGGSHSLVATTRRGSGSGGPRSAMDPMKQRTNKVERFKRQRAGAARLEALTAAGAGGAGHAGSGGGTVFEADEEAAREHALLRVTTAAMASLEDVDSIARELQMLEMMASRMGGGASGGRSPRGGEAQDARVEQRRRGGGGGARGGGGPVGPSSDAGDIAVDPNRPGLQVTHVNMDPTSGLLTSRKESIKAGVFQPGHRLPTMTIEELADIEVAAALERQKKSKEMPNSGRREQRRMEHLEMDGEEDDKDLADEAAVHDRAWDDWKDEHPRGSGNKANKRF